MLAYAVSQNKYSQMSLNIFRILGIIPELNNMYKLAQFS